MNIFEYIINHLVKARINPNQLGSECSQAAGLTSRIDLGIILLRYITADGKMKKTKMRELELENDRKDSD